MTPAQIAAGQFAHRRRWLARSGAPVADQEAKLRPWAAIALRAGADLTQLPPDLQVAVEDYRRVNLGERTARACVADDLCPLTVALETLAQARDAAIDKAHTEPTEARRQAAHRLDVLAVHLGAPAYHAIKLREAA